MSVLESVGRRARWDRRRSDRRPPAARRLCQNRRAASPPAQGDRLARRSRSWRFPAGLQIARPRRPGKCWGALACPHRRPAVSAGGRAGGSGALRSSPPGAAGRRRSALPLVENIIGAARRLGEAVAAIDPAGARRTADWPGPARRASGAGGSRRAGDAAGRGESRLGRGPLPATPVARVGDGAPTGANRRRAALLPGGHAGEGSRIPRGLARRPALAGNPATSRTSTCLAAAPPRGRRRCWSAGVFGMPTASAAACPRNCGRGAAQG
jgi:hypothetical protein